MAGRIAVNMVGQPTPTAPGRTSASATSWKASCSVVRPDTSLRSTACYDDRVSREITQRELRNRSGEIMRHLDEGESFVVTRNGVPVGELLPLRRHRFVAAETAVAMFRAAPPVAYDRFRADLDAAAAQDSMPRG
jgi:antitoxin (DNA-binding transcriptional repressor) of toxin-antitoxin stability system